MMGYSKNDIITALENAALEPRTLYRQALINYRGETMDTHELFTEVISEWLLEHPEVLSSIDTIHRESPYPSDDRDGFYREDTNREEEHIAMDMFRFCTDGGRYDHIGAIIDYQTPLKDKRTDKAGKVDLLAYDGSTLRILELKEPDSKETMLRCVLEGFTYLRTVDTEKLIKDFELPPDTRVAACPFVFKPSVLYNEYRQNRPWLKTLMNALQSKPYFILDKNPYMIEEE